MQLHLRDSVEHDKVAGRSPTRCWRTGGWAGSGPSWRRGGSGLADVLLSLDTEGGGGVGLKGPAQCHVPAGAQALAVILAFSGFAGDFKVL